MILKMILKLNSQIYKQLLLVMKKIFLIQFFFVSISTLVYGDNWHTSSGDYDSSKYSSINQINKSNINKLDLAWVYRNGYIPEYHGYIDNNQSTPIFTGTSLIVTSLDGYLISLDPSSGVEKWRTKLESPVGRRGLTYFDKNIFVPTARGIAVIKENNGELNEDYGSKGLIGSNNKSLSFVPPIIYKNNLLVAHNQKFESYSLPVGETNWSLDLNGARIWSGFSFDEDNKTIIFVTSNLVRLIGKTDIENDFSNSVVLVDSDTGKVRCKFKDTIHDHWDLDMVGNPVITYHHKNQSTIKVVYAFSKTGNIFVVDIKKCDLFYKNFIEKIKTAHHSSIPDQTYSKYQFSIKKPTKLMDLKYNLDEYLNFIKQDRKKYDFIKFKSRRAKYGKNYIPLSLENDVIMYGLHGGPEWPGASLDKFNNQIIISTNHYPWIIRAYYFPKGRVLRQKVREFFIGIDTPKGYYIYISKCQSCHGTRKKGFYESEFFGDGYIPSLNGISLLDKFNSLNTTKEFNYSHKYNDRKFEINNKDLVSLKKYFSNRDKYLIENNLLGIIAAWQPFLDKDGLYASKPPYGKIIAINIANGKISWQIPFGEKEIYNNKKIKGDMNFGGILSTAGDIFFATGTPDKKIRAYNPKNGQELWASEMDYAGSSPPMTYFYNNDQYIIINASGGRFYGYKKKIGDSVYAFKLKKK